MPPSAPARRLDAGVWRCGLYALSLGRPLVMGIVNVTPDSFSDGGETSTTHDAVRAARLQVEAGADIVDVGGESTRPGANPVSIEDELARVLPVIEALARDGAVVSVDTRHAEVASACVEAGAAIVNDIGGFREPQMADVARRTEAGLVVMHMLGEPATMQSAPAYTEVVAEVMAFLGERTADLLAAGVGRERIVVDPGIGFGKTLEHNLQLLMRTQDLGTLGFPVLVGISRKRLVGEITGVAEPRCRVAGSVGGAVALAHRGVAVLRVHDVAETVEALKMAEAIGEGRASW